MSVPVEWLIELLDTPTESPVVNGDLSAAQVAERFGRKSSTIRGWCLDGLFPNAYRLHGREWRIPLADVEALEERQRGRPGVGLGAWRDVDAA